MLKFIYKTLVISLLCGSLTLLDFTSKGIVVNSSLAATAAKTETLKTDKVGDSNLMATLTMTAVGLLTSRLFACKKTPDMLVAAAGGAAFVAGEVLSTIKLKKVMKDIETSIQRDKKGNVNNEQKMALARLRMTYLEAKETAETKKTLQQLAAVAFAAAAVTAYMMEGAEQIANSACTSALTSAATSCAGLAAKLAAGKYTAPLAPPVASGGTQLGANSGVQTTNAQLSNVPGVSSVLATTDTAADTTLITSNTAASVQCKYGTAAGATCNSVITLKKNTRGFCAVPPVLSGASLLHTSPMKELYASANESRKINSQFNNFLDLLIPKAHADLFSPLGIVASGAISFVLATSATLGIKIDAYLYSPRNRAMIWGILAGLVYMATSATDKVIGDIDSNVAKIDAILYSYNSLKVGADGSQTGTIKSGATPVPNTKLATNSIKYDDINLEGETQGRLPCFTGPDPKKCPSFEETQKTLPANNLFDKNTQQQMNSILRAANAYNGTSKISGSSLAEASKIGANANAINGTLKNARKELMEKLKKDGSKTNLDQMEKDLVKDINAAVTKNLKGSSAASMLASIYGGKGGIPSDSANAIANEDVKKADTNNADVAAIDLGNTAALPETAMENIAEDKAATPEEVAALNEATKDATSIEDFEIKNDITKNTDTSIFELITNRYQKSGYPRLFKVKEVKVEDEPVKK